MDTQLLKDQAHQFVEENWEAIVKDIASLVAIRSVEDMDHAQEGMPYGPAPFEALKTAVEIAQRLGLDAHNCDGHIGYADVAGASERQIAIIAHSDIVPEGSGWTFDPFSLTRKDGYLIGRGVIDDKGPLVLELYVGKFFAELSQRSGKQLPYTLRCIIGNNEETDMRDVEWYLEHFEQPAFIFSPDADFPLICGEKGGWSATVLSDSISDVIVDFQGGTVGNAVAGEATALVRADISALTPTDRISVEPAGEGLVRLHAQGIGAHASLPQGSINAIGLLVDYLLEHQLYSEAEKNFLSFEKQVFASYDGSSLGVACQDEYFDPLTLIGGTIRTVDGHFEQTLDCRYPTCISSAELEQRIGDLAQEHGCELRIDLDMVPFLTDPSTAAMQTLVATYNEYTGRSDSAFTIGGGTYARHFKAGGSFGPNDPHFPMPDWIGAEHSADEGFSEEQFKRALEIYIVSVARLMELEL